MSISALPLPQRKSIIANKALSQNPSLMHAPISRIKVVGNPTMAGEEGVFHFTLSLPLDTVNGGGGDSNLEQPSGEIRMDNSPSFTDMNHLTRGVVFVQYLTEENSSLITSNVPEPFITPLKAQDGKPITASQICSVLFSETSKLDQYDFTNEGHGCRHWCAIALGALERAGLLELVDTNTVIDADETRIEAKYRAWEDEQVTRWDSARFPMQRIQGKFYTL